MPYLYIDNFRGFSKTIISFESVNFLVGENSTGKSSILGLVQLLSDINFWFSQDFNCSHYEFGGFRDILSATAAHETEFAFGIYTQILNKQGTIKIPFCYIAYYHEKEALPELSFFGSLQSGQLSLLKKDGNKWKYKVDKIPAHVNLNKPDKVFELIQRKRNNDDKYKSMPFSAEIPLPVPAILGFIKLASHNKTANQNAIEFDFDIPPLFPNLAWLSPIRTKPKRTYDGYGLSFSPEGEHTPYLIRKKLTPSDVSDPFRNALESFGKSSSLFTSVKIHNLGEDDNAPFELLIHLLPSYSLRINSVGYGVSQVMPLVVEMLARPNNSWFAIQQPEVHLHPRAQATLGDLIFRMAEEKHKSFLIETHSDFTIDRFRMNFKKNPNHKIESRVLFFERNKKGGNIVRELKIEKNGDYPTTQPPSFRDFFLKEQIDLLGL